MEPHARDYWWAYVVANLRSKWGVAFLLIGAGVALSQFLLGHTDAGIAVVAVVVINTACVGAGIGAWLGGRRKRHRS